MWDTFNDKTYLMSCKIEEIDINASSSISCHIVIEWHQALAHALMFIIWEAKQMKNVKELMIKAEKNKISTYRLYIISKTYRKSFTYKHKHVNDILDIVTNFHYCDTINFSSAKWLDVWIDKYFNYCIKDLKSRYIYIN